MKNLRFLQLFVLVVTLIAFAPVAFVSCKNLEQTSYVTIGAIGATANASIGAYSEYTKTHPPTPAETATARKVVQTYVDAMETARHAVTSYKAGLVTQTALDAALNALTTASSDVSKILSTLSTKP